MTNVKVFLGILCVFCLVGCGNSSDLQDFTYTYSMESIHHFKVEFQLNPDSTYKIGRYNYFFDKYEGRARPLYKEGKLTWDEFDTFRELITGSRLEKMKDAYGFDQNGNTDNSIVYILELKQGGKSKFVSVNAGANERFSTHFTRLIEFTGNFINDRIKE